MLTLQNLRQHYQPEIPELLRDLKKVIFSKGDKTSAIKDVEQLHQLFPLTFGQPLVTGSLGAAKECHPLRVGVVFSGGQAPGGHNVIAGLLDALQTLHPKSELIGFLDGPSGIIENHSNPLSQQSIAHFRNQGGFDLLGSGRTKIETEEQLQATLTTVQKQRLNGLVIIGGDDSNTNAAVLAEYFLRQKSEVKVIGVPKTIDGDLRNDYLQISFGFDTACKIYAEMIGNLARDSLSAKKYYHFVRLMGRSASHITLECALATHPNLALIGEEIAASKKSLRAITSDICDLISERAKQGKEYGVILIPEGLIEFIPEVKALIKELNPLAGLSPEQVKPKLSEASRTCFEFLPEKVQKQMLLDRDPHGNVSVSSIETETLLIDAVSKELKQRNFAGKFSPCPHFFGYEGRAGFPSNFDSNYCYALGQTTALLIHHGFTGYMSCMLNVTESVSRWQSAGLPLTMFMNIEMRKGVPKPVIQKALVNLQGKAFMAFAKSRDHWAYADDYHMPGPIQFFGDPRLTNSLPLSL